MQIKIEQLEREKDTGGVITVIWAAYKSEGDYQASKTGTRFFTPDPEASNFVPFDELTEADVIGWLNITDDWVKFVEAELDADLANQKNPPVISGLPWVHDEDQL